jgi:hypothetical protein
MAKALLDSIAESRRVTIYHEEDGKTLVESRQDTQHIADRARALSYETPGKEFRLAAFIPEADLNKAFVEGWADDPKAWRKWLSEHSVYKVHGF